MPRCSECKLEFDSLPVLQRHIARFCDARLVHTDPVADLWVEEQNQATQPEWSDADTLTLQRIGQLRRLKDEKRRWREERVQEDKNLLDRLEITGDPLPLSQQSDEERIYRKTRELEVRHQVQAEQRDRIFAKVTKANKSLHSLSSELSGKLRDMEDTRIRQSLGLTRDHNTESVEPGEDPILDKIHCMQDIFSGIRTRLEDIAECNGIALDQPLPTCDLYQEIIVPKIITKASEGDETSAVSDVATDVLNKQQLAGQSNTTEHSLLDNVHSEHAYKYGKARGERRAAVDSGEAEGYDVKMRMLTDDMEYLQQENIRLAEKLTELNVDASEVGLSVKRPLGLVEKQRRYEQEWVELREELELLKKQVALQKAQRQLSSFKKPDQQEVNTNPEKMLTKSAERLYSHPDISSVRHDANCVPFESPFIIVELRANSQEDTNSSSEPNSDAPNSLGTPSLVAWCKLPLYTQRFRLQSGWFRVPFAHPPISPELNPTTYISAPRYNQAELLIRIVHSSYVLNHSEMMVDLGSMHHRYEDMIQTESHIAKAESFPLYKPTPNSSRGMSLPYSAIQTGRNLDKSISDRSGDVVDRGSLGIQIIHVKHAPMSEVSLRLGVYDMKTGEIFKTSTKEPVTCVTAMIKPGFRHEYHVFGHQEAIFDEVTLTGDQVLLVRLYLSPLERAQEGVRESGETREGQREKLVAWTAVPLHSGNTSLTYLPVGTHRLNLFKPPIPEITSRILLSSSNRHRYGRASVKLILFRPDGLRPLSPAQSDISFEEEDELDKAWLPVETPLPPPGPFHSGEGIDIYIDSCRYLPDNVTVTKVTGRVLDREYNRIGRNISTFLDINSDVYNPIYKYRIELREQKISPTATLLLKIYTVDRFTKQYVVLGYSTIKLFCVLGSTRQPDSSTHQEVALNVGGHQLGIYSQGLEGLEPVTEQSLKSQGCRLVPAATLLVRILQAPVGPNGKPLEMSKVPQANWEKLGLWVAPPMYESGYYSSASSRPTFGEREIYKSHHKRAALTAVDALSDILQGPEAKAIKANASVEPFIKAQLVKVFDGIPGEADLTCISLYNPKFGIKIALDGAENLPWASFTHAVLCLTPPGAIYQDPPSAMFDKPAFTTSLSLDSSVQSPRWSDGYLAFPYRTHHPLLCAVIHLHEVVIDAQSSGFMYNLVEQAWTVVPVFAGHYAVTSQLQLPLFEGSPAAADLEALVQTPYMDWRSGALSRKKKLRLVDGASVFIRLVDGRRDEELQNVFAVGRQIDVDKRYIPEDLLDHYQPSTTESLLLKDLVPTATQRPDFNSKLASKFKSMIYQVYDEGKTAPNNSLG